MAYYTNMLVYCYYTVSIVGHGCVDTSIMLDEYPVCLYVSGIFLSVK